MRPAVCCWRTPLFGKFWATKYRPDARIVFLPVAQCKPRASVMGRLLRLRYGRLPIHQHPNRPPEYRVNLVGLDLPPRVDQLPIHSPDMSVYLRGQIVTDLSLALAAHLSPSRCHYIVAIERLQQQTVLRLR